MEGRGAPCRKRCDGPDDGCLLPRGQGLQVLVPQRQAGRDLRVQNQDTTLGDRAEGVLGEARGPELAGHDHVERGRQGRGHGGAHGNAAPREGQHVGALGPEGDHDLRQPPTGVVAVQERAAMMPERSPAVPGENSA